MTDNKIPADQEWAIDLSGEMLEKFLVANREYSSIPTLGAKGMFPDIWRKVAVLKRAVWDGEPLKREGIHEVLSDLFGHILLISHQLYIEEAQERTVQTKPADPRRISTIKELRDVPLADLGTLMINKKSEPREYLDGDAGNA